MFKQCHTSTKPQDFTEKLTGTNLGCSSDEDK